MAMLNNVIARGSHPTRGRYKGLRAETHLDRRPAYEQQHHRVRSSLCSDSIRRLLYCRRLLELAHNIVLDSLERSHIGIGLESDDRLE